MITTPAPDNHAMLADYAAEPIFTPAVMELQAAAGRIVQGLRDRTVWMINSTACGGGVAEMLPQMVALLNELGVRSRWAVIGTDRTEFFGFTKRLHNAIHGVGEPDLEASRALYESVNRSCAEELEARVRPEDILVVHDPQPMPLGPMLRRKVGLRIVWRCHIGLDRRTPSTRAVWRFLRPWLEAYDHTVFSAPEYIPSYLAGRASIIMPAIDPLGDKNRQLSPHQLVGVLCNAGLKHLEHPVLPPPFESQVRRLNGDGRWISVADGDRLGLLYRPIVTQISRWDRLKGFASLLEGFVHLKSRRDEFGVGDQRHRRRLEILRLVLAGPDPGSVQDDPEALEVLESVMARYQTLSPEQQTDIAVLKLPMDSVRENAIMVNAIQRCSTVVAQNSLQEGFGLTVTEAMWKRVATLGTHAYGLRQQIRNGIDGLLVREPQDPEEIARRLDRILRDPDLRAALSRNARQRVHGQFLIFRQLRDWLHVLGRHATLPPHASA